MSHPNFDDPTAFFDPEDPEIVRNAKSIYPEPVEYDFTERDVMLYALGVGETDLKYIYESHEDFTVLPTFVSIPSLLCVTLPARTHWIPNHVPANLLHAEAYYTWGDRPIPTSGKMVSRGRIIEVLDKGKATVNTSLVETFDRETGEFLFSTESTQFIRQTGNFGGKRVGRDRGPATAANVPPNRAPDAIVEDKTSEQQAALYRLSGDYNPLHIDPATAGYAGYDHPILHGLCTMGYSGRHVLKTFGSYKDIRVRFAGVVFPGETIITQMWKEGNKVIFVTKVKERDAVVLSSCAVTLVGDSSKSCKL